MTMALKIAILKSVAQKDGAAMLAGSVHDVACDVGFAATIAGLLDIQAEYQSSLSGWGIMEVPVSRLLALQIDVRKNRLNGIDVSARGWCVRDLAEAQIAARTPGVRIMIQS
jgi:hypothetical protein